MNRLQSWVVEHPRRVIASILVLWLAVLPGLGRLEIATDGRALVPRAAPAFEVERQIEAEFGVGDEWVLALESSDPRGIWNAGSLDLLAELSRDLAGVEGVDGSSIQSLATEPGDHVRTGSLEALPWLEPWPADEAARGALRARVERVELYRGTLLGRESPARSAAIVFRAQAGADRRALSARAQQWLERRDARGHLLYLVGAPLAESRLGDHLTADIARLVPLAFLVMAVVLYARFRSALAVLLPLCGVGFALSATFALLGWSGERVYLTLLVLPVVLTVVGVADAIHILDDYFVRVGAEPARARTDSLELLRETLSRQWKPVLSAELTTALGFVSFVFSPLPPVRVFGACATLGVGSYVLWSLVLLPAALAWLEQRALLSRRVERSRGGRAWLSARCRDLARTAARRRWWVVAGLLVGSALCVHGIARVRVQDSWVDGFAPESATRADSERFQQSFAGIHVLRLRVDAQVADERGRVARPAFDGRSVLLPRTLPAQSSALAHHRLRLRAVRANGVSANEAPLDLLVTGASQTAAGTRLELAHQYWRDVPVTDFLPRDAQEFDFELTSSGRLCDPALLAALGRLETFVSSQRDVGVGRVLGPYGHLETLNTILGTSAEVHARRLATRDGIGSALNTYALGRGVARLAQVWNAERTRTLVTVLVRDASFVSVGELDRRIREFEQREFAPLGLRIDFGGDLALSQAMIDGIVRTQVGSLLASVLGNALVIALALVSLRLGLLAALPCALAVAGNFALMGWADVPLGVATAMFSAMTIGVGVDWAIHLLRAARRARACGASGVDATQAAYAEVGPAVVVDALSVGLGFAVLAFSSVPPSRRLGLLLVVSLFACLVATMIVLPALSSGRSAAASDRPE